MEDISAKVRGNFPILAQTVWGRPLVYLDNAATTQLPVQVLGRVEEHYRMGNGNVHRGIHRLSELSTKSLEEARAEARAFLNAQASEEIIFTSGTTAAVNLVANGMEGMLSAGDEVLVSVLEHHSNFVPWQQLCQKTGATFRVLPAPEGVFDMDTYLSLLGPKTRMVAVTQVSNLTGSVLPVKEITLHARSAGAWVLVDGAQGVRHENTDVQRLDCDFYCFSGHKMMAPAGIGVLYGRGELLEKLQPSVFGGGMVDEVGEDRTTFGPLPSRLEAGTPNYPAAIGLGEAIRYLTGIGRDKIAAYEHALLTHTEEELARIPEVTLLGKPQKRAGVLSFTVENVHPYDLASLLDKQGVAVRSGTHCAMPALKALGVRVATRVSPAFYNTFEEIGQFAQSLRSSIRMLKQWQNG